MSKFFKLFLILNIFNLSLLLANYKEVELENGFLFINSENNLIYRTLNDDVGNLLLESGSKKITESNQFEYTLKTQVIDFVILQGEKTALVLVKNIYKSKYCEREEVNFLLVNLESFKLQKVSLSDNNN